MPTDIARRGNRPAKDAPVDPEAGDAPRHRLDDLLAAITPENLPDDSFDDGPRGAELL